MLMCSGVVGVLTRRPGRCARARLNRKGDSTLPCGTPMLTERAELVVPQIRTRNCLLVRKAFRCARMLPVAPARLRAEWIVLVRQLVESLLDVAV